MALALVGVVGLATPALASGTLEEIRERMERVERDRDRTAEERESSEERAAELGEDLEHTSAELVAADQLLQETTVKVEAARITLQEAELDLADAEAEADRIQTQLGVARASEASIEEALVANADEQAASRSTVGAIARESYKQGGLGSLAATLELLSGEADAVDQMAMSRTVLRVQDQQIRSLATQEAEQVAEQDRLTGVRQDIAYLLARAEAVVVAKDQARAAAEAAKVELESLEADQARARAELETQKTIVLASLEAEQEVSDELEAELARLAQDTHGLKLEEKAELERLAAEEAKRRAEEEARRQAAEEAARQAAAEEAARQRAAEREAARQRAAAEEAQRRADAEAQAEAERRAAAADAEAEEAQRRAEEQAREEEERRRAEEEAREEEERQEDDDVHEASLPSPPPSYLTYPVNAPISSEFGNRLHPVLGIWLLHAGMDFAAGCGIPVVSAADGVVFTSGYNDRSGHYVIVDHGVHRGVNLTTTYMHFQSAPVVAAGQAVGQGEVVGHVGTTGSSTGCHLHFETRENGTPVNPRGWL
ncbi:M23 family metallopeptidase [Ornithinimicrobium sufpigmenti]|uniref:M23 family metallopeptidase n=1 Tax=Ornithinimicrobium sufpigmenti TaxID=2508882 RepID=UPI001035CD3B|nr:MULTISPECIES: M23 family metallopeptidase [unclassified Ornithinimicrobium]